MGMASSGAARLAAPRHQWRGGVAGTLGQQLDPGKPPRVSPRDSDHWAGLGPACSCPERTRRTPFLGRPNPRPRADRTRASKFRSRSCGPVRNRGTPGRRRGPRKNIKKLVNFPDGERIVGREASGGNLRGWSRTGGSASTGASAPGRRVMDRYGRREFLVDVGRGMLVASVGSTLAQDLGLAPAALADESKGHLTFGAMEPLVDLMQDTPADKLLPAVLGADAVRDRPPRARRRRRPGQRPGLRWAGLRRLSRAHGPGPRLPHVEGAARGSAGPAGPEGPLPEHEPHAAVGRLRSRDAPSDRRRRFRGQSAEPRGPPRPGPPPGHGRGRAGLRLAGARAARRGL